MMKLWRLKEKPESMKDHSNRSSQRARMLGDTDIPSIAKAKKQRKTIIKLDLQPEKYHRPTKVKGQHHFIQNYSINFGGL